MYLARLASGAAAVVDPYDRNRVVFIGLDGDAADYIADHDSCEDEDGSIAFARHLEDRAAAGSWFGRD